MERNELYPIFLKLHQLRTLVVGAGAVGEEKLSFMLKSSPRAEVTVVATWIGEGVKELLDHLPNHRVTLQLKPFEPTDLTGHDLVIAATNDRTLNAAVQAAAKAHRILVNVADTPALCDFYLGSVVTRGPLKIGISTNGQSPTFAKRFREVLEDTLPEEVEDLLGRLQAYRNRLTGDFAEKVRQLNDLTALLLSEPHGTRNQVPEAPQHPQP